MIGQGFGGAVFPPFSESFGRKNLYIISTALYSFFCLLPGVLPYLPVIIIGRFGAGVLSAIPTNVVAGSIEDMFNAGHRIWMIFAWLMAANLGLALGPIYGAFVVKYLGWYVNSKKSIGSTQV
jgi:MFS family permease